MGPSRMTVQHKKKLVELVHAGMLEHELQVAIEYSASLVTHRDWMLALGTQAALTTPKDVLNKWEQMAPLCAYQTRSSLVAHLVGWTCRIAASR